jgi:predicted nucleic acid-binding protein
VILADTGPLVALSDPADGRHAVAIVDVGRLAPQGLRVCDAVIAESCFHLPHRAQRARLQALLRDLRVDPVPTHEPAFRADVFAWLLKYADHQPDWADGCLAVLAGRDARARVWTYDAEFRTTWRRPDGRAIPLAVRRR